MIIDKLFEIQQIKKWNVKFNTQSLTVKQLSRCKNTV